MDQATESELRSEARRMRDDPRWKPGPHKAWKRKCLIVAFSLKPDCTLEQVQRIVDEVWP